MNCYEAVRWLREGEAIDVLVNGEYVRAVEWERGKKPVVFGGSLDAEARIVLIGEVSIKEEIARILSDFRVSVPCIKCHMKGSKLCVSCYEATAEIFLKEMRDRNLRVFRGKRDFEEKNVVKNESCTSN